jgi:hypothetical protein
MYCEDMEMVVIAKDKMWAEELARLKSDSFKNARLRVTEIDIANEQVVLISNKGA